jgi:hypothetical protein
MKYTDDVLPYIVTFLRFSKRTPLVYNYSGTDEDLFLRPHETFQNEKLLIFRRKYIFQHTHCS